MKKSLTILFILSLLIGASVYASTKSKINTSNTVNLKSGLVGWWTFDGGDYLSATTIKDKSGSGNTGTLTGGVTKINGKIGQAMKFDGSTGYMTAANSVSLQNNIGTMSVWIKTSDAGVNYRFIVNKRSAYSINTVNNTIGIYDWSGPGFISSNVNIANNKWHFITVTFQSGITNGTLIYIDGVLKLTTTMTVLAQTGGFYIGENSSQEFAGLIDDVRIYNRALSAQEIYQLYQQGKGWVIK